MPCLQNTLPQKKRKFFEVAFLLGKSVHHLILFDKIDMTLDQGPRGTVKNWHIKVAFLLGKSVLAINGSFPKKGKTCSREDILGSRMAWTLPS